MSTESFIGRTVTIKSTGEKGVISEISRRRSGTGAMSARYIIKVSDSDVVYECMPHEVKIDDVAPMMGMSY